MSWLPLPMPGANDIWGAQLNSAVNQIRGTFNPAGKFIPRIGDYLLPAGLVNNSTTAQTSGRVTFLPVDVFNETTFSDVAFRIDTNASGGTTSFTAGIYEDSGEGNAPDTSKRLAHTPTADPLTSGTNKELALNAPVKLAPGRYWVGSLYYAASAPSTTPTMHCVSGIVTGWLTANLLWFSGAVNPRCLYLNGETTLPTTATTPSIGYAEIPPIVALKRSA